MLARLRFIVTTLLISTGVAGPLSAQTDLAQLFDPPTQAEIDAVVAEWSSRPTAADQFTIEQTAEYAGFAVARASFVYDGLKQYGLLRFPREYQPLGSYPVLVFHHGGQSGIWYGSDSDFGDGFPSECLADSAFMLVPTYRGEAFIGGDLLGNRISEGSLSLWDWDCDDAMAMVTAFLAATPAADSTRVTSFGRSRGGGVAYHMALRDPRVRRSVIMFGPSDFAHPDIVADCDAEVNDGVPATHTLSSKVMAEIVNPWLDGEMTLAEARLLLTGWSIRHHLVPELSLQIHHGELDTSVPIDHAELVNELMTDMGAGPPEYAYYVYPQAGHNMDAMDGYEARVEDYLCNLPPVPPVGVEVPEHVYGISAWPNPFAGDVRLDILGADKAANTTVTRLRILDLRGRLVRALVTEGSQATFHWDGRDQSGHEVPAGVYLVKGNLRDDRGDKASGAGPAEVRGRILKLR